jgi:hypothetical protein
MKRFQPDMDHEKFNMEKHDWMDSTRYHERMTERLDLNIGVWQENETIQLREPVTRIVSEFKKGVTFMAAYVLILDLSTCPIPLVLMSSLPRSLCS